MRTTRRITYTALFAALATVVMYFEMPLPFMPPFLKLDFSGAVILIAGFIFGPVSALLITLVKDLIHLLSTQTGGVGELADFIISSSLVVTASVIYKWHRTKKGALIGCLSGAVLMVFAGVLANKFLLLPFYSQIMPFDAIISACAAVNPMIANESTYLWFGVAPFNLIKSLLITLITFLLYKKLSFWIHASCDIPAKSANNKN